MAIKGNTSRSIPVGPCYRCGQDKKISACWPDGRICRTCYGKAIRTHGICAGCGTNRLLPGLDQAGRPTCVDCSGVPLRLRCTKCGIEQLPYGKGLCPRCYLDQLLDQITNTSARPNPIQPVIDSMKSMLRPLSGIQWLRNNDARQMLRDLSDGSLELTHERLDQLDIHVTTLGYVRELLITHGLLPQRDSYLAKYEAWLRTKTRQVVCDEDRRVIESFGRWHHLKRLRAMSGKEPVTENSFLRAKQSTTVAIAFLGWLRAQNQPLAHCSQTDIDNWYSQRSSTKTHIVMFLYWARRQRLITEVNIPRRCPDSTAVISQRHRADRVSGSFVLLYGQPISRVTAMRKDQVIASADDLTVVFASDPVPVPALVSDLLNALLLSTWNLQTSAHANNTWLFPGMKPGKHLSAAYAGIHSRRASS